ncbi:polysaccharide deacetylase family protein [Domibacillus robiginosus]|uniref:polysaccharide deacetylase family protein n=1 Tax=Domibacillus robiginosus TaxID=1071054 RepID=UPI00067DABB9|nr:polysaccharide deacetylase family protein [Domibacillus robiginosus]
MNKKTTVIALLSSVFLMLAMVLVNLVVTATQHHKTVWATSTSKSAYENISIKTKEASEKRYQIALQYPIFKQASLNKKIEQYTKKKETDFLQKLEQVDAKKLKRQPASLRLTFELILSGNGVYSVLFRDETYINAEKNDIYYESFIVDMKKGRLAKASDLFIDPQKASTALHIPVPISEAGLYVKNSQVIFFTKDNKHEASMPFRRAAPFLKKEWRDQLAAGLAAEEIPAGKGLKKIALTFDDGPNPKSTAAILATLKKHDAKATFFMLGSRVEQYPELVDQVVQEGHEIGNHSFSHRNLAKLDPREVKKEIDQTALAVEAAAGVSPLTVRPPYGATNATVNEIIGAKPMLWTVDTMDWKSHNPKSICGIVKKEARDGSIVLMHDIHQTTAQSLDEIVTYLQKEGYELVTVSEL